MKKTTTLMRPTLMVMALLGALYGSLLVASWYVAQQRYAVLGFCPINTNTPGLLVFDTLRARVGCIPLPMPQDRGVVPPHPPSSQQKPGA